ncbi:MAG: hypothetical protein K0U98_07605 [Deltaproteobacteria bacterium]|nr:hypothetical protein [Deltaproteobacteria bacterium]
MKSESVSVVEIESERPKEKNIQDLVAVAQRERAKRQSGTSSMPIAVINNENLEEYATSGELTYVDEEEVPEALPSGETSPETTGQEEYWRDQALETRLAWKQSVEERQRLEDRAAELRRHFYSEDDPFVRDGQIKPEWDRVLEQLAETRTQEVNFQRELQELYEEAQEAGADPSWIDEGIEFEPVTDKDYEEGTPGEIRSHEVLDPPSVDGGDPQ